MQPIDTLDDTQLSSDTGLKAGTVALASLASAALAACGGGGGDAPTTATAPTDVVDPAGLANGAKPSTSEAWRFLNQATMGPSATDIATVTKFGYDTWLNQQFALPSSSFVDDYFKFNLVQSNGDDITSPQFTQAVWWKQALTGKDQLRQRVAFALSEITVASLNNNTTSFNPIFIAGWMDTIAQNCFGSYRDFIEATCKSPAMGIYLSHLGNDKPISSSARIPDQNFARELLQLFTIGLVKLDEFGMPVNDTDGKPLPASPTAKTDVRVLSHVFTGWGYGSYPAGSTPPGFGDNPSTTRNTRLYTVPMAGSSANHASNQDVVDSLNKSGTPGYTTATIPLLGATFSLQGSPQASLTAFLDLLFGPKGDSSAAHDNLAPFIAKQMIQRLVTSNPSAAYVRRVATVFRSNYWSLRHLVRAILIDDEARKASSAADLHYGKLREPLLRITHLLRAFTTTTEANGKYFSNDTSNAFTGDRLVGLNQAPYTAPSVFNFFSPDYKLNKSVMSDQNKVAPEFALATETSVASYINAVYETLVHGFFASGHKVKPVFTSEAALAANPADAVAAINAKLMGNTMSPELAAYLVESFSGAGSTNASAEDKIRTAVLLTMASPEYLIQK